MANVDCMGCYKFITTRPDGTFDSYFSPAFQNRWEREGRLVGIGRVVPSGQGTHPLETEADLLVLFYPAAPEQLDLLATTSNMGKKIEFPSVQRWSIAERWLNVLDTPIP